MFFLARRLLAEDQLITLRQMKQMCPFFYQKIQSHALGWTDRQNYIQTDRKKLLILGNFSGKTKTTNKRLTVVENSHSVISQVVTASWTSVFLMDIEYLGISLDISGYLGISWDISGYLKMSQDISEYLLIPQDISEYLRIARDISVYLRTSQDIAGYLRIS